MLVDYLPTQNGNILMTSNHWNVHKYPKLINIEVGPMKPEEAKALFESITPFDSEPLIWNEIVFTRLHGLAFNIAQAGAYCFTQRQHGLSLEQALTQYEIAGLEPMPIAAASSSDTACSIFSLGMKSAIIEGEHTQATAQSSTLFEPK